MIMQDWVELDQYTDPVQCIWSKCVLLYVKISALPIACFGADWHWYICHAWCLVCPSRYTQALKPVKRPRCGAWSTGCLNPTMTKLCCMNGRMAGVWPPIRAALMLILCGAWCLHLGLLCS